MQSDVMTYSTPNFVEFQPLEPVDDALAIQRIKNQVAIRLLQVWMADESGYDEKVWEQVKKGIDENRLSNRKKFDE